MRAAATDAYWSLDEIHAWLQEAEQAYPDHVRLESVGESLHGRPIWLVTLGDRRDGDPDSRPAFWLDGGTHCAEWAGIQSCLHSLSQWLKALDSGSLGGWLEQHTIYVLPCISPDGYHAMLGGAPYLRSTLRPPPQGRVRQGLEPSDVDGDGVSRWMRWKHPAGNVVQDETVPLFMRPRTLQDDPQDAYFVCAEGHFVEWDGVRWITAPLENGLDLNRNFPGHWDVFSQFGMDGGEVPMSAPESRAVVDAFRARKNVAAAITNHTFTGCLLSQPYRPDSPVKPPDVKLMKALADDTVAGTPYRVFKSFPDFTYDASKPIRGVWSDTLSTLFGVPGYTLEIWDPWAQAGHTLEKPALIFTEPDPAVFRDFVAWASQQPDTQPWTPVNHPQLGAVEVGGIDRQRTLRNPPLHMLAAELDICFQIHDRARRALPRLTCETRSQTISPGITKLSVVLENQGFLNTCGLERAHEIGLDPGLEVRLTLEHGLTLVQGDSRANLGVLDGWGTTRVGAGAGYLHASLPGRGHRALAEWTLQGSGSVTVSWWSLRAGRGSVTLGV